MLRLRTTTGLSALALAIGIAGTAWLSSLTDQWRGPGSAVVAQRTAQPRRVRFAARQRPGPAGTERRLRPVVTADPAGAARAAAVTPPPELVPLATPSDDSLSWDQLRGHLDGRVVLHIETDGEGRVSAASVVESSGDAVLDDHALRTVRGWRFRVPADHADGIAGELPMLFSSRGDGIARVP
ncbi:MAG: energy transducer TonB [Xanthomonadaceae bacterium]|nr:energy transducer TonB [Xanthomonadaceae bacterium]MDE2308678.1 energy transducer TonB [Xanthomonadaceae bacterium]